LTDSRREEKLNAHTQIQVQVQEEKNMNERVAKFSVICSVFIIGGFAITKIGDIFQATGVINAGYGFMKLGFGVLVLCIAIFLVSFYIDRQHS
jgi:hypothetical protein